jgi:hypothetical protein
MACVNAVSVARETYMGNFIVACVNAVTCLGKLQRDFIMACVNAVSVARETYMGDS